MQFKDRLKQEPQNPVMLLDRDKKTLCGIYVGDLNRPIRDPEIINKIKSALAKTTFNVRYKRPWPKEQEEGGFFRVTLVHINSSNHSIFVSRFQKEVACRRKKPSRD